MKTSYSAVVLTLTCLLGLGTGARAQDVDKVNVSVPFDFVAGGQTLPAGRYKVTRASDQAFPSLIIRSSDSSAFMLPMFFDGVSADHAKLSFTHVGGKYFLSEVKTATGVYALRTPRPMTQAAQVKDQGAMSSYGTN